MQAVALRNRERIFVAARECFAEMGARAGMKDIANRAGIGVGTLYRNFASRSELAEAIYRETVDDLVASASRMAKSGDPWDALVEWMSIYLEQLIAKQTMLSELRPLFARQPHLLEQSRDLTARALDGVLARCRDAGRVRSHVTANDIIQLVNGVISARGSDLAEASALMRVILDGIRLP